MLTEDGRNETEVTARIGMAKDAFNKRKRAAQKEHEFNGEEKDSQDYWVVRGVIGL